MSEKNEKNLEVIRHSLSHIMAAAAMKFWPKVKFAIGPAIDNGFYYDYDFGKAKISDSDLLKIEEEMKKIIKANLPFAKSELPIAKALAREKKSGQVYKEELIKDLNQAGEATVSYYKLGEFEDLCRGPHTKSSGQIQNGSWKLTKIAGAYWRGDEKNKMLTRIYGLAFASKQELDEYLIMLEEAEKRDHRKLGKELKLFMISEEVGRGLPLWLPNGAFIRKKLEDYMYELERKNGYSFVYTPVLANENLYKKSGHLAHYKDDMYNPVDIEGEKYYLKPMNCPHHHIMFRNDLRSYRELPVRFSDFSPLYRFERSGVLTGLIRARCFSQNDAHIYCAKNTVEAELIKVLEIFKQVYDDFNIKDYWFRLSLPDFADKEKFGDIENKKLWQESAAYARAALEKSKVKYVEGEGEAAFYGPKIDVQIKNVLGKEDTIATAQVDFYMPERFDLEFINDKGKKERPVIIHRAIMGSFDRFFAFLAEQTAGAFPVWLAPAQAKIISVGQAHVKYCQKLADEFRQAEIRAEVDDSDETVGNKIRKAVAEKVPYMLVVGDKEAQSGRLAVRDRGEKTTREIGKDEFMEEVREKVRSKK